MQKLQVICLMAVRINFKLPVNSHIVYKEYQLIINLIKYSTIVILYSNYIEIIIKNNGMIEENEN